MTYPLILHIPHSSSFIPSEIREDILLTDNELTQELLLITDRYTDETSLRSPQSEHNLAGRQCPDQMGRTGGPGRRGRLLLPYLQGSGSGEHDEAEKCLGRVSRVLRSGHRRRRNLLLQDSMRDHKGQGPPIRGLQTGTHHRRIKGDRSAPPRHRGGFDLSCGHHSSSCPDGETKEVHGMEYRRVSEPYFYRHICIIPICFTMS